MLDGYHRTFNGHAYRQLVRSLDTPDISLGVGDAEAKHSMPLQVILKPMASAKVVHSPDKIDWTKVAIDGQHQTLSLDDFPQSGYLGVYLPGV